MKKKLILKKKDKPKVILKKKAPKKYPVTYKKKYV